MAGDQLADEVARIVQSAASSGRMLKVRREARLLQRRFLSRSLNEITQMILRASSEIAGISIELDDKDDEGTGHLTR
ncbi:MAG TPA: hypothetical protein VHA70_06005 [Bauldia sp.]|nr:hypothetical protein [Bauldia sp.]